MNNKVILRVVRHWAGLEGEDKCTSIVRHTWESWLRQNLTIKLPSNLVKSHKSKIIVSAGETTDWCDLTSAPVLSSFLSVRTRPDADKQLCLRDLCMEKTNYQLRRQIADRFVKKQWVSVSFVKIMILCEALHLVCLICWQIILLGFCVAVGVVVVTFCVPPLLMLWCVATPAMQAMTSNARRAIAKPWQTAFLQGAIDLSRIWTFPLPSLTPQTLDSDWQRKVITVVRCCGNIGFLMGRQYARKLAWINEQN